MEAASFFLRSSDVAVGVGREGDLAVAQFAELRDVMEQLSLI